MIPTSFPKCWVWDGQRTGSCLLQGGYSRSPSLVPKAWKLHREFLMLGSKSLMSWDHCSTGKGCSHMGYPFPLEFFSALSSKRPSSKGTFHPKSIPTCQPSLKATHTYTPDTQMNFTSLRHLLIQSCWQPRLATISGLLSPLVRDALLCTHDLL